METENKRVPSELFEVPKKTSILNLSTFCIGTLYITGYLISTIFTRDLGIGNLPLLKAQYLETGLVFFIITCTLIIVPIYSFHMIRRMRETRGLGRDKLGASGNAFYMSNFLFILIFCALFVTYYEWHLEFIRVLGKKISFENFFYFFLPIGLFLSLIVPVLERLLLIFKKKISCGKRRTFDKLGAIISEILRFSVCFVFIFIDIKIYNKFSWIRDMFPRGFLFLIAIPGLSIIVYWVREFSKTRVINKFLLVLGLFIITFYYFAITSYALCIYKFIPMSRGGKLPIRTTEITISERALPSEINCTPCGFAGVIKTEPLYLIEENIDYCFILKRSMRPWILVPEKVFAIKKSEIISQEHVYIKSGEPRINIFIR